MKRTGIYGKKRNEQNYNYQDEEVEENDFSVEMIDDSRYTSSLHVSKYYIGSIIGKKGAMKMRIERETRTTIKIPRQGQTGDIVILGSRVSDVQAARKRINNIVVSSRLKQRPTHFISIPMNSQAIMENFQIFKEKILRECSAENLEESLFIAPQKLHLTVGVMCLMDNEERIQVSELLRNAKDKIIMPLLSGEQVPVKIRLKGLDYMNDDPRAIHILYGNVEELDASGVVQKLADALVQYFMKAGFMKREFDRDNVKLHVTLINSSYRDDTPNDSGAENQRYRKGRQSFNGSEVLAKFGDYDFGVAELKEIHLALCHTVGPDGNYQSTFSINCGD